MKIGVISDTHGRLRPEIARVFDGVDHILHAGDIGGVHIIRELERIAPVTAAAGNVDDFRCGDAGKFTLFEADGLRFLVTHILDRPYRIRDEVRGEIERSRPDVVVFGHSHLPHNERVNGLWLFNPGSAGPRRFDYPVSVGIFECSDAGTWSARHLPLDEPSHDALTKHMNQLSR